MESQSAMDLHAFFRVKQALDNIEKGHRLGNIWPYEDLFEDEDVESVNEGSKRNPKPMSPDDLAFREAMADLKEALEGCENYVPDCCGSVISLPAKMAETIEMRMRKNSEDEWTSVGFLDAPLDVQRIAQFCDPAPFGDLSTMTTVHDSSVRTALECPLTDDRVQFRRWIEHVDREFDPIFGRVLEIEPSSASDKRWLIPSPIIPQFQHEPQQTPREEFQVLSLKDFLMSNKVGLLSQVQKAISNVFDRSFQVEPLKLNLYPEGGFFKPHVDTPVDGRLTLASLVVGLPSSHEGGILRVRSKEQVVDFDFSSDCSELSELGRVQPVIRDREFRVLANVPLERETDQQLIDSTLANWQVQRFRRKPTEIYKPIPWTTETSQARICNSSIPETSNDGSFFWNSKTSKLEPTVLPWCAFFSDRVHEVLPVSKGHRLTLTFTVNASENDVSKSQPPKSQVLLSAGAQEEQDAEQERDSESEEEEIWPTGKVISKPGLETLGSTCFVKPAITFDQKIQLRDKLWASIRVLMGTKAVSPIGTYLPEVAGVGIMLEHSYTNVACDSLSNPSSWDRLKGSDATLGEALRNPPPGWKSCVIPVVRVAQISTPTWDVSYDEQIEYTSYSDDVYAARVSDLTAIAEKVSKKDSKLRKRKIESDLPENLIFVPYGGWGKLVRKNVDPGAEHTGNEARASSMDKVYYACAALVWEQKE